MKNQYPQYDLEKTLNLTWYLADIGLSGSEIHDCLATLILNKDQLGINQIYKYEQIRLAWSLIKCGVRYEFGHFIYRKGNSEIRATMDTIIDIILAPIATLNIQE